MSNRQMRELFVLETISEDLVNWIFVATTGFIAYHGITFRDKRGEKDSVRLLFGCIALLFCILVLARDILNLWR